MHQQNQDKIDDIAFKIGQAVHGEPQTEAVEAIINILLFIIDDDPEKLKYLISLLSRIAAGEDPTSKRGLQVVK